MLYRFFPIFFLLGGLLTKATTLHAKPHKPCKTCMINGATSAYQGQSYTYNLSGCTTASWTVTCGTIQRYTSTSVTILFGSTCTNSNIETAGATGGGASINVIITAPPLASGGINNPTQTINYGATPALISANAATGGSCSGSYTYQWYSSTNGTTFTAITGATSVSYQPGALTVTTYYEQKATCGTASVTSSAATVTVYPQIVAGSISPSTQTINYGGTPSTLTLSGVSGGSGTYTYQWQSSTSSSFSSPTNVGSGTTTYTPPAGATSTLYYHVIVTSNGATGTSSSAVVNVYPSLVAGSITPSTQTINYGGTPSTLTLSGVSGGSGTYTYQWQSSTSSSFSSPTNVGSGTTTYTPPAGATSTLYYHVIVTSNGATSPSSSAVVNVYPPIVAGSIGPSSQTVNYGGSPSTLTLSGVSGGSGTYTYQWQSSPDNTFGSPTNVGSGTTTYTPPTGATATLYYRVVVTSNGATGPSSSAVVTVYPSLAAGSITPSTQTINYGGSPSTLTLSGVSGGSGTYTYQWQSSPDNTFGSPTNVGSGTTTYTPPTGATSTLYYRVVVTSNGIPANSSSAVVNVYPPIVAGSIGPSSQTVNYGGSPSTLTLSGVSGGSGTYTYQWQSSPDNTFASPTNVGSGTTTYTPPAGATSTLYYRVVVTSNGATGPSTSAVVTVYPQIVAGSITPSTQTINYGGSPSTLTLSGLSGGSGTYTYQWQSSPDNTFASPTNVGSGTTTYTPPAGATATLYYQVVVTSNGTSANSSSAVVTVYPPLVAGSISPSTQTVNNGGSPSTLTLSGVSGGSGTYTYQWQSSPDNTFASPTNVGSGTTTYTPPAGATATLYYQVVVTSNGISANSSSAVVTVYPSLVAGSITPSTQSISSGGSPSTLTLSGVSGGNGMYTYQWQRSPDNTFSSKTNVGSGTTTYTPSAGATSTLYYRVVVTSNGVTANSSTAVVNISSFLSGGGISPATQSVNYGGSPSTLVLSGIFGGNGTYTYQWQSSPDNTFGSPTNVGSGTTSYTPPTGATSTLYYRVVVTSNGTSANSTTAVVNVIPQLAGGTISGNTGPINYNTSPGLLGSTQDGTGGACSGNYTYQWQYSADGTNYRNIVQAIAATYTPVNLTVSTYFRRQVICGSGSAYSNAIYVQVTPQRVTSCTQ